MELLTLKQASAWASGYLKKEVKESNIAYLIQYGKIRKAHQNGSACISKTELKKYYDSFYGKREFKWKGKLGEDLNWHLSFDYLTEADTTKHVHRLHPYKGKFIPQLVEYFIDDHTDEFKKQAYFKKGDIILDPFCGSGTALVQSNELGMHAIGIDISEFNSLISNAKIAKYDLPELDRQIKKITQALQQLVIDSHTIAFEEQLLKKLLQFNTRYFPSPEFKFKINQNEINEDEYGPKTAKRFLPIYERLLAKYEIRLQQNRQDSFLDKWYLNSIRNEIDFVAGQIRNVKNASNRRVLEIILSRTIRSCRATTHSDLTTLVDPMTQTYYCPKHKKVCKPLFTITRWWQTYCKDTLKRLTVFDELRTETHRLCLTGDSRRIELFAELEKRNPPFAELARQQKIQGIFSSPPYVGLIDYHEQHAYAYELFGFTRRDRYEIGPLFRGKSEAARKSYIEGISEVLNHCQKFLATDFDIFLVANDKFNLYPAIAEKARLRIVQKFKRPVLNRSERDKAAYSEIIFHLKKQ